MTTNLRIAMNEFDELVMAMAAVVLAAIMLVAGGLYIDSNPINAAPHPAAQMASAP